MKEPTMNLKSSQPSRVLLGVSGGIAAYKAAEVARLLVKADVAVDVVMTANACRFIQPMTFHALTGRPVSLEVFDDDQIMRHIALSRNAAALLIAPATANCIAKLANGIADDMLTSIALARDCPLFIAPAMNSRMWHHPATQRNIATLARDGAVFLGPDRGILACGEEGVGRMLEPNVLVTSFLDGMATMPPTGAPPRAQAPFLFPTEPDAPLLPVKALAGKKVLITAGPTFEAVDPVRGLTNRSSGKMGFAIAAAAEAAGAQVTLIAGPVALPTPTQVTRVDVVSAAEMANAVFAHAKDADIFIGVAAVADYTPEVSADHKLKKEEFPALSLTLKKTTDILDEVGKRFPHIFRVGFAAETRNGEQFGEEKRQRKNLPLLVLNHAVQAFGADDNQVILLDDHGSHPLPKMSKQALAAKLVEEVAGRVGEFGMRNSEFGIGHNTYDKD
jgi:phosphopantothenoylcysteine decarboxylase/phosphopantothenate--cysteine ligase